MTPVLDPALLDLGIAPTRVDPFGVQPGVILFERFCVVGRVRHSADFWRVQATDLDRKLGVEPHHRVDLHFLPQALVDETAVRSALPAHQRGTRRIEGVLSTDDGLVVVSVPGEEAQIRLPLSPEDAITIARALTGIVLAAVRTGVVGFRFDLRDLRFDSFGELQFAAWRHLTGLRSCGGHEDPDQVDAPALVELFESLGDLGLRKLLGELDPSVAALAAALDTSQQRSSTSVTELLPGVAPFTGRELVLHRLHEAMASARHGGLLLFSVSGPAGVGKSRLLSHLALEFQRWNSVHLVQLECSDTAPHHGLAVLLDAVASAIEQTPPKDRPAVIARVQRALFSPTGTMGDELSASPRLRALLGDNAATYTLQVEDAFIRRSSALADCMAALGTPERPLALLIDDFDRADASIRAVMHQLVIPTRRHHSLIVLSVRDPDRPLALPLSVTPLPLRALPQQSVKEILAATLPGPIENLDRVAARLLSESQGVPAQLWALLQQWLRAGILVSSERGSWVLREVDHALPPFLGTVAGQAEQARVLAALLAIREEPVSPSWLAEAAGLENTLARTAAGSLLEAGVLVQDSGGRLGFQSELVRKRVLEDLEPEEVRKAHGLIQRWLLSRGSPILGQLAWHAENASRPGPDPELADLHLRAGQEHLKHGDVKRAQWHFERALERIDANPASVAQAKRGIADALVLQDRRSEALRAYLDVMDHVEPREALAIADDAMHSFYLRGCTNELLVLSERALGGVGQTLPRNSWDALLVTLRSLVVILLGWGPGDRKLADGLTSIYLTLVAGVLTSLPHVGFGAMFAAMAAASAQSSPTSARARSFFAVILGALGMERRWRRLLERAEHDARTAQDPLALGVVLHQRGQIELAAGYYDAGSESLQQALQEFRRGGDLSVGVISMAIGALYAVDREPTEALLTRLRTAETTAWRQRNTSVLPGIEGIRLYARARAGELDADEVERQAASLSNTQDVVGAVAGGALAAMALVEVGRAASAMPIATRARAQLDAALSPPFLEVARLAEAEAAVVGSSPIETARSLVKALKKRARTIPSLRVGTQVVEARLSLRAGAVDEAIAMLASVIEQSPSHGERWRTLEAHQLLSEILAGRDVLVAQAHAERAAALAAELGVQLSRSATPAPPPAATPPRSERAEQADSSDLGIWELLDHVGQTLETVLPPEVRLVVRGAAGVRAIGDSELVELLVVNLVLLVRDALSGVDSEIELYADEVEVAVEDTAAFDLRPGRWARLVVTASGAISGTSRGALAECRTLCGRCRGHLVVDTSESSLRIETFLPAPHGPPPAARPESLAVVMHPDEDVRRSLIDGLRRSGWSGIELPPGEECPPDAALVFADARLSHLVSMSARGARVVRLARRGEPSDGLTLRLPFLVSELERLLQETQEARATSAPGSRPG